MTKNKDEQHKQHLLEEEDPLYQQISTELDAHLFQDLRLDTNKKQELMIQMTQEQTNRKQTGWLQVGRNKILMGIAAAAVMLIVGITVFQNMNTDREMPLTLDNPPSITQPGDSPAPTDSAIGSGLSELVTVVAATPEEAEALFGEAIVLPDTASTDWMLQEIQVVGMPGEAPTRVHYYYQGQGEAHFTYTADRQEAVIPVDLFDKVELPGTEGLIFAQPTLTELFWQAEGVQYSIMGTTDAESTVDLARSALQ